MEYNLDQWTSVYDSMPLFEGQLLAGGLDSPLNSSDGNIREDALQNDDLDALDFTVESSSAYVDWKENARCYGDDDFIQSRNTIHLTVNDDRSFFTASSTSSQSSLEPYFVSPNTELYCPGAGSLSPASHSLFSPALSPACPITPFVPDEQLSPLASPIDATFEYGDIDYFVDDNAALHAQSLHQHFPAVANQLEHQHAPSFRRSSSSGFNEYPNESAASDFLQLVPDDVSCTSFSIVTSTSMDSENAQTRQLEDATNVCAMLQQLSSNGMVNPIANLFGDPLAPVSLEDVESVLSCSTPGMDSIVTKPSEFHRAAYVMPVSGSLTTEIPQACGVIFISSSSDALSLGDIAVLSPSAVSVTSCGTEFEEQSRDAMYSDLGSDYLERNISPKIPSSRDSDYSGSPYATTDTDGVPDRRQKKKNQNKTAAQRYRQKKRAEKGTVFTEVEQLEMHNAELKDRVSELNREINYIKGLMDEICRQ